MMTIPKGTPCVRLGDVNLDLIDIFKRQQSAEASKRVHRFDKQNRNKRFIYPQPTFIDAIATQTVAGTAYNTYTTAKSVIPVNSLQTLPPNYWTIGRTLEIDVMGALSNIATTPGTITFQVMLQSVIAFTTGPIQMDATAHTALPFWFKALLQCRGVGSGISCVFMGQAWLFGDMFTKTATTTDSWGVNAGFTAGAAVSDAVLSAPDTTPANGTGFDSTSASILDFFVGFSISNAGNGITVQQYRALSWA